MTEPLSDLAKSSTAKTNSCRIADDETQEWRHDLFDQVPALTAGWPNHEGLRTGKVQDLNSRFLPADTQQCLNPYGNAGHLVSSGYGYYNGLPQLQRDTGMHTWSTQGFPADMAEDYFLWNNADYVRPPAENDRRSTSNQSCTSARSDLSMQQPPNIAVPSAQRPVVGRATTAPEPMETSNWSNKDSDEECVPAEQIKGVRGRKRQRVPHTTVERRYRENINAHLVKLWKSLPASGPWATTSETGDAWQDGVKPSKCDILKGAITCIEALDKENKALKSRLGEMEKWHPLRARHTGS
ncbi:hypothetical protein LTR56_002934 [Elasticomyces elasticus]|nr:hypothetical protein LTR56_002934 [Elasticomyces elasticus]KAK3665109.1 hypothetical protein LTR22_003915 [Elasticomyces elasticus]KAK4930719.1 hypothetical protein LTR49_002807 [Elasticomyces elasticus]KAK5759942.1 hypothetical protein LTS12_009990 [Elasticomyces elasticus]